MKALLQLGVTAHLRKPVQGASVYAALYIGLNEMEPPPPYRRTPRRRRRAQAQPQVRHQGDVAGHELSAASTIDEAFQILRRESMKQQLSVEAFSEEIVRKALEEGIAGVNAERG